MVKFCTLRIWCISIIPARLSSEIRALVVPQIQLQNWIVCGLRWACESLALLPIIMFYFIKKIFNKIFSEYYHYYFFLSEKYLPSSYYFSLFCQLILLLLLLLFSWSLKPPFLAFLPILNFSIEEKDGKACQLGWNQGAETIFLRGLVTASVQRCSRNTSPHYLD